MFDYLIQLLIISVGAFSAYLLGSQKQNTRKWGFVLRFLRQIPFAILFYMHNQYLMFIAAIIYLFVWGLGLRKNWGNGKSNGTGWKRINKNL